jgi:hypothetical protein
MSCTIDTGCSEESWELVVGAGAAVSVSERDTVFVVQVQLSLHEMQTRALANATRHASRKLDPRAPSPSTSHETRRPGIARQFADLPPKSRARAAATSPIFSFSLKKHGVSDFFSAACNRRDRLL